MHAAMFLAKATVVYETDSAGDTDETVSALAHEDGEGFQQLRPRRQPRH